MGAPLRSVERIASIGLELVLAWLCFAGSIAWSNFPSSSRERASASGVSGEEWAPVSAL